MRLQVALAKAGCASRRKSAVIIKEGRVRVNGRVVTEPGFGIDISRDKVTCSGREISFQKRTYILFNKPIGVITSASDTHGRKTVFDFMPDMPCRLHHAGRLDKDSSGLLLLTNDGEVAYRLTHPKFEIERAYEVVIKGRLEERDKRRLMEGIYLDGKKALPCAIHTLEKDTNKSMLKVRLREGRKRQIRNMFEKTGYPVLRLRRVSFGPLELRNLKRGEYRFLKRGEIESLKEAVGLKE